MGKGRATSWLVTLCMISVYIYYFLSNDQHHVKDFGRSLLSFIEEYGTPTQPKHVTVFPNGASTGGVELSVNARDVKSSSLAAYLSKFVKVEWFGHDDDFVEADRVYSSTGALISSFSDIQDNDKLYLVAPGLLFVWPFVKLGHKVLIEATESPTGHPIILESFTESPRTFHVHNFFTDEEADKLIDRILEIDDDMNKLQQSHVGHQSGKKKVSSKRTSENAFDQVSPVAVSLRKRAFALLGIGPYRKEMCDGLQLLRYTKKQAYTPHNDWFSLTTSKDFNWDPANNGSNRFATVFLYLSNVTAGGQTVFPNAELPADAAAEYQHQESQMSEEETEELFGKESWEYDMVQKCKTKLAAYPKKGHAILFYSQKPNGEMDTMSLHGGCPVLEGTKWAANLWVWNKRRFGIDPKQAGITDADSNEVEVDFINTLDVPVDLYWSNSKLTELGANQKINYKTFHNHEWHVKVQDRTVFSYKIDKKRDADGTIKIIEQIQKDEL